MRDYNQIQFRSPSQKQDKIPASMKLPQQAPHSPMNGAVEKVSSTTASTTHSSSLEAPRSPLFRSASPTPTKQQQQHQEPKQQHSSSNNNHSQASSSSSLQLSPNDALLLRRDGPEAVITKLRQQLETVTADAHSSKSAVSKSEAVILELRSSVRQLKRQVETVQQQQKQKQPRGAGDDATVGNNSTATARDAEIGELQLQLDKAHAQILTADMVRKELEDTLEAEQYTWELRVQDQERTIVELQEAVTALQQQLEEESGPNKERRAALQRELEQARQEVEHWRSLCESDNHDRDVHERILALEQERSELQGCLDEALKELEAVDAELQNDNSALLREENERLHKELQQKQRHASNSGSNTVEPLQHLYRWILEREGKDEASRSVHKNHSAPDLVKAIQSHLEEQQQQQGNGGDPDTAARVKELQSQVSVYRGDLKAREESSTELRGSLKEAVALLKPLEDAVAKADKEKARLQEQLDKAKHNSDTSVSEIKRYKELLNLKDDEIDALKQEIESLELQLSKAKLQAANSVVSQHTNRSIGSAGGGGGDDFSSPRKAAKRQSEEALKQMLSNAQLRFNSLDQQNQQVEKQNHELEGRLRQAGGGDLSTGTEAEQMQKTVEAYEQKIHVLENEASVRQGELAKRDVELRNLQSELEGARLMIQDLEENDGDHNEIQLAEAKLRQLEEEVEARDKELSAKKEAQRLLNKSLKDALGLIKPLQLHLEEAEQEKRELAIELQALKRQSPGKNGSRSVAAADMDGGGHAEASTRELESTIVELERENAQLQDALEDMSLSLNASHQASPPRQQQQQQPQQSASKSEARLREELVELKSRYEVTQGRLDDSFVENHTLVEALQKREQEENAMLEELKVLREQLDKSQAELDSAKYIATAALVKIEQMTRRKQNGGRRPELSEQQLNELYREKQKLIEQEMSKIA